MSTQDQQELRKKYYGEAMRYMDNATECLKKAIKKDGYYNDQKYVRMACGTAYSGVLIALDCFFILKGVHKPTAKERKSTVSEHSRTIEYYQQNIAKIDQKMLNGLNSAYKILHLLGYYDGIEKATVVKDGFDEAYKIIEKVKPETE